MKDMNKLISNLTSSLDDLKALDLTSSKELSNAEVLSQHSKIKESQKLASAFQQELSPIQKNLNRKRIDILKKQGRKSKEPTKAELLQEVMRLKQLIEGSEKE